MKNNAIVVKIKSDYDKARVAYLVHRAIERQGGFEGNGNANKDKILVEKEIQKD